MVRASAARIVVIDDDPEVVDLLVTCLHEEGYEALGALTSDEGLKLVILAHPDLVLLDVTLPGMNGIDVLKRIRSIAPATKVVMVTANTDPLLAREALGLGALAYVDKPFDYATSSGSSSWRSDQIRSSRTYERRQRRRERVTGLRASVARESCPRTHGGHESGGARAGRSRHTDHPTGTPGPTRPCAQRVVREISGDRRAGRRGSALSPRGCGRGCATPCAS
jgi:two-component system response regulator (stage 0 sporulation protein F)